jgi:aquaporin Z
MKSTLLQRASAEFIGTMWLVLGGCGAAVLSAKFPEVGIGFAGVALAFGLSVMTMAYALGGISGAHFNPAITIGLWAAGRTPRRDVPAYVGAQVLGAIVGAAILYVIASGAPDFDAVRGFAANGYGDHSPGGFSLGACLLTELVLTFGFVFVVLGSTDEHAPKGFAPLAIGLALTVVHLVSIPVTNASVNPARSTGPALFAGAWAVGQLWMFWALPLVGGVLAGIAYPALMRWTRASRRENVSVAPKPTATGHPVGWPLYRKPTR